MKTIALTQGKTAKVDDADHARLSRFKWCAHKNGGRFYAVRRKDGRIAKLHREVIRETDPSRIVDHINHDGLDCRRQNLRVCSHQENIRNRAGQTRVSSSGIRGVSWDRTQNRWLSYITISGKRKTLGSFKSKFEAGKVSENARRRYFGAFSGEAVCAGV